MNKPEWQRLVFVGAVVGLLALPLPGLRAQGPPNPAPGGPTPAERGRARVAEGGGPQRGPLTGFRLDDKQRELLREATQKEGEELRKLNEKLQAAQKEFTQAVVNEKYDEKVVREKADAVARIHADIAVIRGRIFATVAPTLKPEQREQLENSQVTMGLIMSGGGRGLVGPGGGRGPEGEPGERAIRRREPGTAAPGPDGPRRRPLAPAQPGQ